jgi:Zn-dependent peptidase ImmA (M78 family)
MAFTTLVFGRKLQKLRSDFCRDLAEVAAVVGMSDQRLKELEDAVSEPTGDELLILADYFKKDFRFFLNDNWRDASEEISILFREHGGEIAKNDRVAISEFSLLCSYQQFLESELGKEALKPGFQFQLSGSFYKGQGEKCALALRQHLGLGNNAVVRDIFDVMRQMGFKVFRRRLENSSIAGLFMSHPEAGPCILVNLSEGQARQRFSAAHEWAHGLLDQKPVTFSTISEFTSSNVFVEIRANSFASCFLIPPAFLRSIPQERWSNPIEIAAWAEKLRVSVPALLAALVAAKIIDGDQREVLRSKVPRVVDPVDPELEGVTDIQMSRRIELMGRGLTKNYVDLAMEAYFKGVITRGLLGDMLLTSAGELAEIAYIFGKTLRHE